MTFRLATAAALAALTFVAACGEDSDSNNVTGTTGITSTVRFVNATGNSNINVANNGTVSSGNSNLAFGGSSSCMNVNTTTPNLTFTNASTNAAITGFAPSFTSGENFTVVAFTDASGATQFTTLNNAFTPTSGQAGLQIFNAANGSGNIVALGNGTALGSGAGVGFGTSGSFMSVPAGTSALTFNTGTGTSTVANAGNLTFNAGQNYTLLVGPAATGTTTLRTTLIGGC
jgi:hypothetical protein